MKNFKVRDLVVTSLFIALVYVFTWVVKIQLPFSPNGGLIHLGNVPFFLAAIFFDKRVGMTAGALGMGLFDLTSGWILWSPMTVISALIMGYILNKMNYKKYTLKSLILSFILVALVKVVVYYIGEIFILSSFAAPLASIPGNLIQIGVSSVIVLVILKPMEKVFNSIR
ncbi:ECF transporter S component [Peptoniphilus harei]|uniref:ECF transporter S component n=1 Tax=Peptoniphilus harei TaxID=54005 RepID=UPI002549E821|nr:ECF transporter S component [Peptoniphilus harei]MDK7355517.1 ECF transporter S component [Peptoniphilus harei]MDK7371085.1 ECF transporter S component [Peptoniphilus harei]